MSPVGADEIAGGGDDVAGVGRLETLRLHLVESIDADSPADRAHGVASRVSTALAALSEVDPSHLDAAELRTWLERVDELRRMVEAAAVTAAGAIDRSNPFRAQGFFSTKTVVKHLGRLSGPEAHRRVQTARLHHALPEWADAETDGRVGVAQSELMARIAANPRIPAADLERDSPALLDDAINCSYDEFERRVRTWQALADPDGDRDRHEHLHTNRNVTMRPRPEGGWTLTGNLAEPAGAEFNEIFSWFLEAEWHTDWTGRPPPTRRDRDHRRSHPNPAATNRRRPPRHGPRRRLHPDDAITTALIGHIRRVVYETTGTIIDLGRRQRLFRDASRDAVMLLSTTCVWIGCDRPTAWCDADHSLAWKAHGATVPRNGQPLCHRHNQLKEHGFHVHRDNNGTWHVTDPHGNEIS